jgi:hypothetical protein
VYVTVAPDGTTNVPAPKIRNSKENFVEQFLDLKVQHFELHNGFAEYNSQRAPLDLQGNELQATLAYEAAGPRYTGTISSRRLQLAAPQIKYPLVYDVSTKLVLERNSIQVLNASLSSQGSKIELKGAVSDLAAPKAALEIFAAMPVVELNRAFKLPLEPTGGLSFAGKGTVEMNPFEYSIEGKVTGRGLAFNYRDTTVINMALESRVQVTPKLINLRDLDLAALNGHFHGEAQLADLKRVTLNGSAHGFSLQELALLAAGYG